MMQKALNEGEEGSKSRKKEENLDFIQNFLKMTEGIQENKTIYQDIIDNAFKNEMQEIGQDDQEYVDTIATR